jgi:hypothetical protein
MSDSTHSQQSDRKFYNILLHCAHSCCFLLFKTTGTPNDIVCPCASEHLPCCKSCTEGFAIPLELKRLIESKSQDVVEKSTTEDGCNHEDLKRGPSTGVQDDEIGENRMRGAANNHSFLKVERMECAEPRGLKVEREQSAKPRGLPLVDSAPEHKISSHALADGGHDDEHTKPPPAVQEDSSTGVQGDKISENRRGAANNHSCKVERESAGPRGLPLVNSAPERKISSHALADIDGDENMKLPPAVQEEDEISKKDERGPAHKNTKQILSLKKSKSEHKIITHALADGHDDDVMAQVGRNKVTRQAMQSLKPGQWIKDEVINSFFHLLSQRDGELCKNDVTRRKRNGFFNSFFMTKLLNEGHSTNSGEYEYNNIRNWSTKFVPGGDIFEVDKLYFVINVERQHWVLAVVDISNQKIQMYDSGSQKYNYQSIGVNGILCLQNLFRYLQDEHLDKKKTPLPNANHWQLIPCQSDTSQQQNGKFQSIHETGCMHFSILVSFYVYYGRLRLWGLCLYVC